MSPQLDILALEPFYGGMRRSMLQTIIRSSRHRWTVLKLPARRIERRLVAASKWFAEQISRNEQEVGRIDVLFTGEAMNLADLFRLNPRLAARPAVVYFHDNQLPDVSAPGPGEPNGQSHGHTGGPAQGSANGHANGRGNTPLNGQGDAPRPAARASRPAPHGEGPLDLVNLNSAMSATQAWFNSQYHLNTFLARTAAMVQRHPELASRNPIHELAAKSHHVPPPVDLGLVHEAAETARLAGRPLSRDPRTLLVDLRDLRDEEVALLGAALTILKLRGERFTVIAIGPRNRLPRGFGAANGSASNGAASVGAASGGETNGVNPSDSNDIPDGTTTREPAPTAGKRVVRPSAATPTTPGRGASPASQIAANIAADIAVNSAVTRGPAGGLKGAGGSAGRSERQVVGALVKPGPPPAPLRSAPPPPRPPSIELAPPSPIPLAPARRAAPPPGPLADVPTALLGERDDAAHLRAVHQAGIYLGVRRGAPCDETLIRALEADVWPVVPDQGAYPEFLPPALHRHCLHHGTAESVAGLILDAWHADHPRGLILEEAAGLLRQFDGVRACRNLDERLEQLVAAMAKPGKP